MMILDKSAILAANDRPLTPVEVPEWGGTVYIRVLTGKERDAFEASYVTRTGAAKLENLRARLLALCLADDKGNRIFGDDEAESLGGKSAKILDKLFSTAQSVNGLTPKDVEELRGN